MSASTISPGREAAPVEEQPVATAISAQDITKTYELRPVLRSVSFTLAAGSRIALLGPNGAGKTTLLRILSTLAKPSAGFAAVAGYDVSTEAGLVRRVVGFVGHQPLVYDELTARENLLFFARMYGLRDGASRVDQLLTQVELRHKANELARTLSRGQVQRLALARGILHEPQVLLLDEPDTGLDADALALLEQLLQTRTAAGQTTLFTTHQIEQGLSRSDAALVLVNGRVVYSGPAEQLGPSKVRELYASRGRQSR
jgi:heme ABC exporter ATP-binding subunit CcmA